MEEKWTVGYRLFSPWFSATEEQESALKRNTFGFSCVLSIRLFFQAAWALLVSHETVWVLFWDVLASPVCSDSFSACVFLPGNISSPAVQKYTRTAHIKHPTCSALMFYFVWCNQCVRYVMEMEGYCSEVPEWGGFVDFFLTSKTIPFDLLVSVSTCSIAYCSFEHTDTVCLFQFWTAEANENGWGPIFPL